MADWSWDHDDPPPHGPADLWPMLRRRDDPPIHGEVNGWCRVVGIPLKAKDCPECQVVMAAQEASA